MKKNISKLLLFAAIFSLTIIPVKTYATGETEPSPSPTETPEITSIKLNKSTLSLEVGSTEKLTVTHEPISIQDPKLTWKSSDTTVATVTEGTVRASGVGEAKITVTSENGKTSECTVTVVAKPIEIVKSTDATLKSLTISNGTLNKSFKSTTYDYEVTVDSNITSLSIKPVLNDINAGYLISENKNLKNGSIVKVVVTAEDGKTQKQYKFTVVKAVTNLNLKSLKIKGYALNEVFNSENLKYTLTVPNIIEEIIVQAAAESPDATVSVSGASNLKVGDNTVIITVKDSSNNKQVYEITVTREEEDDTNDKKPPITSSDNNKTSNLIANKNSSSNNDDIFKYIIVSIACLILFAIGGIGVYFYIKTSPKKLKKQTKKAEESPIIEVKSTNQDSIRTAMDVNLVQTREFDQSELSKNTLDEEIKKLEIDQDDEGVL